MKDVRLLDINSNTGKLTFNLRGAKEQVSGRNALLQLITLNILNARGSNVYNVNKGNSVASLIGGTYNKDEADVVKTLIALAIDEVEQQIIQEQNAINFSADKLDEKLKSMEVYKVDYNENESSWDVKILVKTAANNIGIIRL